MSTKKQIIDYVTHTPENVNSNVLSSMLDSISGGASSWADLTGKPFDSVGNGLKVESGALTADTPSSRGTGEGSMQIGTGVAESDYSVAEGLNTKTLVSEEETQGRGSHAEGIGSIAKASGSHAEGNTTMTLGSYSHAEGSGTTTGGVASHAEGNGTVTNNFAEHAEGSHNVSNKASDSFGDEGNTISSIGIGTSLEDKKNAWEVMQNGDAYLYGVGDYDGTNTSEATSLQDIINTKQDKLTAGANISIDENNVISTTGGASGSADWDAKEGEDGFIKNKPFGSQGIQRKYILQDLPLEYDYSLQSYFYLNFNYKGGSLPEIGTEIKVLYGNNIIIDTVKFNEELFEVPFAGNINVAYDQEELTQNSFFLVQEGEIIELLIYDIEINQLIQNKKDELQEKVDSGEITEEEAEELLEEFINNIEPIEASVLYETEVFKKIGNNEVDMSWDNIYNKPLDNKEYMNISLEELDAQLSTINLGDKIYYIANISKSIPENYLGINLSEIKLNYGNKTLQENVTASSDSYSRKVYATDTYLNYMATGEIDDQSIYGYLQVYDDGMYIEVTIIDNDLKTIIEEGQENIIVDFIIKGYVLSVLSGKKIDIDYDSIKLNEYGQLCTDKLLLDYAKNDSNNFKIIIKY